METNINEDNKKVKEQIFWYSFANYAAYALGFLAFLFVYPSDLAFLGRVKFIETIGHLVYPFLLFGLAQSFVNFNPLLKRSHAKTFFGNSMVFIGLVSVLAIIILNVLNYLYNFTDFNYYFLGVILAIALAYIDLIKSRSVSINKVSIPVLLEKILPKILLPILFIYLFRDKSLQTLLLQMFSFGHFIIAALILVYVLQFTSPRFSLNPEHLFENFTAKDLLKFCSFSLFASFGSLLAFRVESFIIPQYLGFEKNGLYSFAMMFSSLIAIPSTGFTAVIGPKISYLVKKNLITELGIQYKLTAKNLFFSGFLLYSCIYVIVPDFLAAFVINHHKFDEILPIITILGLGVLVNIATGFNTEIISFSKYYIFNILSILLLVIVNLCLCYYFLTSTNLGLMGVAIASTVSMITYNAIKLIFIYQKFQISPFDLNYIKLIVVMTVILIFVAYLPSFNNHLLNLFFKSTLLVALNFASAKFFKLRA